MTARERRRERDSVRRLERLALTEKADRLIRLDVKPIPPPTPPPPPKGMR